MNRAHFAAATAALAAMPLTRGPASAATTELTFGSLSPSASEWMIYIADTKGFFAEQGLHLTTVQTGNVQNAINAVATKSVDFVSIGSDSVMAAQSRQLAVKFVIPGYNTMPYALVTGPQIKSWADLKGKTVAVGAKQDVTGILMRIMATANKLDPDKDLTPIVSGSTSSRFIALQTGNVDAVFLNPPFDFFAETKGMRILARASDYAKSWQFTGFAMNPDWVAAHRPDTVRLARAFRKAVDFAYKTPREAIDILQAASKTDTESCRKTYELAFVKTKSFDRNLKFDEAGLRAVAQAMRGVGTLQTVPPISDVVDASIALEAARG
jgi:ABC-type nitrate/sulfonate/bicarbonate transport system substrate-binding protein